MNKTLVYIFFLLFGGSILLSGCRKDSDKTEVKDSDTQTAQDNALAEGTFNDVNNIANQAVENNSISSYRLGHRQPDLLSSCATVTVHDTSGHGTIEVFFQNTPCLCNDLRYRKGTIHISYSGMYRDSGTVITITFDNYYVGKTEANMYKVMGTKTVTNKGHNAAGHLWFDIVVNGSLVNTAGQTMTWNSHRQREWTAGESTTGIGNWTDDEYMITGSANGISFNGTAFTLTITQALHIKIGCPWIEDGKIELTPGLKPTRYIDYGSGSCDAVATVTISGVAYTVSML